MKIAHVLPGFPVDYSGGITNYVRTLIESQVKAGHQIVLASGSTKSCFTTGDVTLINIESERPGDFSHSIPRRNDSSDDLYKKLQVEGVEIVHFHTVFGLSESSLANFWEGTLPYVVSLHDYYIACPRVFMMDKWGGVCRSIDRNKCSSCVGVLDNFLLLRKIARKLNFSLPTIYSTEIHRRYRVFGRFMASAKLVMAVSNRVAELFAQTYPSASYRTIHIGNASATAEVPIKTASNKIRVTYLGTFSKHKGGDLFLELVSYCSRLNPDIEFKFYGKLEIPYDKKVTDYPIVIGGKYVPSDIPKIMAETDIGVAMPIWEDNGPQVVMEMVNYGTPVLATAVGGIPDFIPAGGGLVFHPDDPNAREQAYRWVAGMTKEKLSECRKNLRKLKSPAQHEIEIVEVYKECI